MNADTITDDEIRELRERYGEGSRTWDPHITNECDLALGDAELQYASVGVRLGRRKLARARCAEILILNARRLVSK